MNIKQTAIINMEYRIINFISLNIELATSPMNSPNSPHIADKTVGTNT